jgi:hypothetical protein
LFIPAGKSVLVGMSAGVGGAFIGYLLFQEEQESLQYLNEEDSVTFYTRCSSRPFVTKCLILKGDGGGAFGCF